MQDILESINRLRRALDDAAKRQSAQDLGSAIGSSLGTAVGIYRTPTQIEAMSIAEIDAWADTVEADQTHSGGH